MGVKFGTEEGTFGPLLRAIFHPHRCNVSPLRGENPPNRPLSKLNNRHFALRAMLPVNEWHESDLEHLASVSLRCTRQPRSHDGRRRRGLFNAHDWKLLEEPQLPPVPNWSVRDTNCVHGHGTVLFGESMTTEWSWLDVANYWMDCSTYDRVNSIP